MRKVLLSVFCFAVFQMAMCSCGSRSAHPKTVNNAETLSNSGDYTDEINESQVIRAMLVSPRNPRPGEVCQVLVTGGKNLQDEKIEITGPEGVVKLKTVRNNDESPSWRIEEFIAGQEGEYRVEMGSEKLSFKVADQLSTFAGKVVWKTERGWDSKTEALYSAWINALFLNSDERSSWTALHEVTQNKESNFLYNFLRLGEDDPARKSHVLMQPDCADNPFYLRAYFAWKLGLPFGYHECDRGSLNHPPGTGRWITNEIQISNAQPVQRFNSFLRMVMNGVHSGTARTALNNENSDYYPVPLTREALRPGVVFADPYGHTLILVRRIPQTSDKPGVLLSVDAQPDGTVGIKRFWKGNFLFNTSEVIGEPGFKAFRPIVVKDGKYKLLKSGDLTEKSGYIPFSLQQQKMKSEDFYHTMERVINPKPLDPETALLDLIEALHEQLLVRVTSVENGEKYMKAHPGEVIPMPTRAVGVFQAGGQWEDFSTPNRDLRLLIAMDAVLDFPDKVKRSPEDFKISRFQSPEHVQKNMEELLKKKMDELSISYNRTNGTQQKLTLQEILKRKDAFEMAYNPNDGIEIRWGAPEGSAERSTCKRHVPQGQQKVMNEVRVWFHKRMHPPT